MLTAEELFNSKKLMLKYAELINEKEKLIREKLTEKGFGHLIEGIEKRRFPKICQIKQGEWTYVYADNDTDEGAFIIAYKEFSFTSEYLNKDYSTRMSANMEWKEYSIKMKANMEWQDTHGIESSPLYNSFPSR
jgi:hypothetical protein